jgi:hypothetical protein
LKLAERSFGFADFWRDFTFENNLGPGRHFQIDGAAFDQLDVFLQ